MKLRIPTRMQYWWPILIAGLLWLVGFTYGSGWGAAHNVYRWAERITVAAFLLWAVLRFRSRYVRLTAVLLAGYLLFAFFYYQLRFDRSLLDYFWLFLLLPLMEQLTLEKEQMSLISLLFVLGSFVILLTAHYGTTLAGWDENSISMPAFFSYTVFAASFGNTRNWKRITIFAIVSVIYFYLLWSLNSRSAILFSILLVLCVFSVIPMQTAIRKRAFWLILLTPLAVAILTVLVRNTGWIHEIDAWSATVFRKPLFNGRDNIWLEGFRRFWQNPILGNGSFGGNWHNSAVTLLVGVGTAGYLIYLGVIAYVLQKASRHSEDYITRGLVLAYLTVWLQQSVELGLVAPHGDAIPFAILGLALARARTLEKKQQSVAEARS